jgi:hypothetical protein
MPAVPLQSVDRQLKITLRRADLLIRLEDFELADVYLSHANSLRAIIRRREDAILNPLADLLGPSSDRSINQGTAS